MTDRTDSTIRLQKSTGSDSNSSTRLISERWQFAARAIWIIFFVITMVTLVRNYPLWVNRLIDTASDPSFRKALASLGLTPGFYVAYQLTLFSTLLLAFFASAIVLFWRKSNDRMVFILSLALLIFGYVSTPAFSSTNDEMNFWIVPATFLLVCGNNALLLALYIFPDGQFVPRWLRWVFLSFFLWDTVRIFLQYYVFAVPKTAFAVPYIIVLLGFAVGFIVQFYRYRYVSTPLQRQQSKWILLGGAITLLGIILNFLALLAAPASITSPNYLLYQVAGLPLTRFAPLIILVTTIMFSTLRYRLWEVDLVINRSVAGVAITGILGVVFLVGLIVLQKVFEAVTGGQQSSVAIVISALVVGALFQPTRIRVRRFVDHRLYGLKVDIRHLNHQARKTASSKPVHPGTRQFGPYAVNEMIGRGGMGEIYRGQHETLGHTVAVKVLPMDKAVDTESRTRFELEARTVSGLHHPNIVQVFDYGLSDTTYYMVMEYIEGENLADYIRRNSPLPLTDVQAIVRDIAAALDYAHHEGLVHRDVKPSNVMLQSTATNTSNETRRRAVLMDFGIARIVGESAGLTGSNVLGTLDYIAPEQIMASATIDYRADIYSLGAVVYQMLTGRPPFKNDSPGVVIFAHLQRPAPDPRDTVPDLPKCVSHTISKAMAKKPEERFATAQELADALTT